MGLPAKLVRAQLNFFKPFVANCSLEITRKGQDKLGELMEAIHRRDVIVRDHDFGPFQGAWIMPKDERRQGVVLYLHGGGYTCGNLDYAKGFAATLSDECGVRVFCAAYRLAPEDRFPAALDDAVVSYQYLLSKGYPASQILLCGFGRIGKLLARKLRVLGADVTVSARKAQDLELARILGFRRIKTGNWAGALAQYDGIVNTVPAPVVIPEHLQSIRKDCALLELASLPGGFCTEAQALPGYLAARGLPGQYAPESAAAIIRSAIFRSLNQEEAS